MPPAAEIRGMSIVLLGDFDPQIFAPAWFGKNELIRPTEADEADVKIVHPEVAEFGLDWVRSAGDAGTLCRRHQPGCVLRGIQGPGARHVRTPRPYSVEGDGDQHARAPAHELDGQRGASSATRSLRKGGGRNLLTEPGMADLTMQGVRPDGYKGCVQVTVQPSRRDHGRCFPVCKRPLRGQSKRALPILLARVPPWRYCARTGSPGSVS